MIGLNCYERITILELIKNYKYENNSLLYNIFHSLRSKISFTEKEIDEYGLELINKGPNTGNYKWNNLGNKDVEIDITEKEKSLIIQPLQEMEDNNIMEEIYKSIYVKFIIYSDLNNRIEE